MSRSVLACLLAVAAACGGGDGDGGDRADGGTDVGDDVFGRELLEVRIDLDPDSWDQLRNQIKTRHSQYGRENCRDAPAPNPYTWFAATVTIDGEELPNTGVRKKGNIGSQSTLIPSMKLRFDEFVDGQRFHGLERIALNNSRADPSYARTCLGYAMFAAAGFAAPRCTWAHVVVNGQDLGPYIAIDEVHTQFLARHFERADGNLYEGTACDFRDDAIGGFEQETNQDIDSSRSDLAAVLDALAGDDDQLRQRLAAVIDLPEFISYWSVESLVWHRDGYSGNANNYFVYADPARGGRFRFIPWGPDAAFHFDERAAVPDSVLAYGVIANRLYAVEAERGRYYDALAKVIDNHWDPDAMVAEAARVSALVRPLLPAGARAEHDADLADLEEFISGRRDAIEQIMAGEIPDWTDGLRVLPCRPPVGPVAATFTTTWGSLSDDIYAAGDATIALELDGAPVEPLQAGARAGLYAATGQDRVQLVYDLSGQRRLTFNINLPEERWFESYMTVGVHPLVSPPVSVTVLYQDVSVAPPRSLGRYDLGEGTWTFDEVGTTDGAAVRGSFDGTLFQAPSSP
ncbi:MAG TPA: CotH kinase family protein [Kofleriaceae bacterium]|nr:CotH kinase family protein [Kofleriaceae bacterium]